MKRFIKIVIILLVIVGLVGYFANRRIQASKAPPEVKVETVGLRDLYASVLASGKIDAKTRAGVSSEVTGRIIRIHVREGDQVQKGQLLIELDTVQYASAVERATAQIASSEAQLSQTRNNLEQAQRNLDRQLEIQRVSPGAVPAEQIEQLEQSLANAKTSLVSGEAQILQTRASLKEARDNLARTKLYAPISGRVVRLAVEEGEVAQPGTFSRDVGTLMNIADLSTIQAKVRVDETNLVRLSLGDSVHVTIDAFPDTSFVGRVTKIANSAVTSSTGGGGDQAVNFEVEVTLANPPSDVRPDLSMTARIITDARHQVPSIPMIALTARTVPGSGGPRVPSPSSSTDGEVEMVVTTETGPGAPEGGSSSAGRQREREGVFVLSGGVVRFRPVKVGITGEDFFEVLDGVAAGDTIVTGTYQAIRLLQDSMAVRVTGSAGTPKGAAAKPATEAGARP